MTLSSQRTVRKEQTLNFVGSRKDVTRGEPRLPGNGMVQPRSPENLSS